MVILSIVRSFLCFLALLTPFAVLAQNKPNIVINEIAWMGQKVENVDPKNYWRYEWLELYNNTTKEVSLENWRLELSRQNLDWSLLLSGKISPNSYFLVVASDKISPVFDLNYQNLGGKFNNQGQQVVLKDSLNNIIDVVDCFTSEKWFAGDNNSKQTMERKNPFISDSEASNWQTSASPGGTPKLENSQAQEIIVKQEENIKSPEITQPEISFPSGVVINELLPSPLGPDDQEEWIEIANQNNFPVDVSNWQIEDLKGKTTAYVFPEKTVIPAMSFILLSRKESNITLNNDEDGLKLSWPSKKTADQVDYKTAPRNQSYNRGGIGWFWSEKLTPGEINRATAKETEEIATIIDKSLPNKEINDTKTLAGINKAFQNSYFTPYFIATIIALFSGVLIVTLKKNLIKNKPS